ncbi:hypothetical protein CCACVL1_13459 [Corchorus capsularis]|uniref:DUF7356 domain-containing protein n=1 Tax=Corchorus capsularis TaxID=210143 RepID=A0A1R3IAV9_COCAP|nr:hypothetical protein CCACVL1_13459 [Corchorus capsularis]
MNVSEEAVRSRHPKKVSSLSSESDPKGNVNGNTILDQKVDDTVNPNGGNDVSKSVTDSIGVNNGGDQSNGLGKDIQSVTGRSTVNQQSDSNGGENLQKNGKESSDGGKKDGEIVHKVQEGSDVEAEVKMGSEKSQNVSNGQEGANVGAKGTSDGEEEGKSMHNGKKSSNLEEKGRINDDREGENVHKDQKGSKVEEEEGKTGGENGGEIGNMGQEGANVEVKGVTYGEKESKNMHMDQEASNVVDKGKKGGEKDSENVHKSQEGLNLEDKGKADGKKDGETKGKLVREKEDNNVNNVDKQPNIQAEGKINDEEREKPGDSLDPKGVTKEKNSAQDSVLSLPTRKDGVHGEECDPNMCMDNNERFSACLRVPGNDFADLSLLIQNKGKGPLNITISAPAFVHLEKTEVELQEKEDKKVKVSIKTSGKDNLIVLKDGSGECSLDFKEFMVHNPAEAYVNILSQTPTTAFIFVVAVLILVSGWMWVSFRRRQLARSGLKYQRLDMELPISAKGKTEPEVDDGWDNSWADNWDDEEAPMTPSKPVTPRLSSKGLASRRSSKEGWKD